VQRLLKKPILAISILLVACAAALFWWHLHGRPALSYRTAQVKRGDLAATISATGTIEPVEVVDVGAQVAGLINSFGLDTDGKSMDYGSTVEEGGVLAKIDDSVYAADLAVAKAQVEQDLAGEQSAVANLDQMKAKLIQAGAEWKRAEALFGDKLMAEVDYDTDKANFEVAKSNVSVADAAVAQARATTIQGRANLEKAQRNVDFCTITSPVRGVIIDRRVNIGETVVSSLNAPSLFLIAKDLNHMQIWVSVNEADVGRVTPGAPVTFTCDAFPDRHFQGSVGKVRLNATMNQNVVMYTVEVNTDNPDNVLLPYLTANVLFIVNNETNALLVPNAALRWSPPSPEQIAPDARPGTTAEVAKADPPGDPPPQKEKKGHKKTGTVWLWDGEFVRPVEVKIGATDGSNTAVTGDGLDEGQEAVLGETTASAQAGTQNNPFVPVLPRR
jgi:HlyD family secretion protein